MEQTASVQDRWNALRNSLQSAGAATCAEAARVQREVAALIHERSLPPRVRPLKIACLRSVTVEPVLPLIVAAMAARDFAATVELGQFGNHAGEMLSPDSFVARGDFDVCLVLVPFETIVPGAGDPIARRDDVGQSLRPFLECLDALAAHFSGLIIVGNFALPASLLARRFQSHDPVSPRYALAEANRLLAAHVRSHANIVISDVEYLSQRMGTDSFYCSRNMMAISQPFSVAGFSALCRDWAELCALHFRGAPKCIVVDCDGTLWGGVVGEDGIHGIRLGETYPGVCYQQFQRQLRQLKEVGFLLALNSRNDEADVRAVFEQHPGMVLKYDDFSAVRVNWNDKAANMAAIADELNLGTESLVFIDDNAFELERVRSAHPGIACLAVPRETWKLPELLPGMAVLDRLSLTAEDRAKSAMYARERQRDALRGRVVSFDDYLRQLDLRMTIEGFTPERHLDRAVQLLQKTNQFNLTTRRHSQREVLDLHEAGAMIHVASLADRFGDYGRIALSIIVVEAGTPLLDTFLMSCRALGRKAETALMNFLKRELRSLGFQDFRARYIPSGRNGMCADFLPKHGFQLVGSPGPDQVQNYRCPLPEPAGYDAELCQVIIEEEA